MYESRQARGFHPMRAPRREERMAARSRGPGRTRATMGLGALLAVTGTAILLFPGTLLGQAQREAPLALEGAVSATPWKRYSDWPKADWGKFNTLAKTGASPPKSPEPKKMAEEIK